MFISKKMYTNRNQDKYYFQKVSPTLYRFVMEGDSISMKYCRIGGKEGQDVINNHDLGMFDPSGGPCISLGTEIDGMTIVAIASTDAGFMVGVKQ